MILYTGFATLQHLKYFFPTYVFKYKKKILQVLSDCFYQREVTRSTQTVTFSSLGFFCHSHFLIKTFHTEPTTKQGKKINKIKINNSSHRLRSKIQRIQNTYWYFLPTLLYKNYNHKQPWENAFITQIFSTNTKNTVSCIDLIELTVFCALGAELVWPTTSNISSQSLGSKHNPSTNLHLQWLC